MRSVLLQDFVLILCMCCFASVAEPEIENAVFSLALRILNSPSKRHFALSWELQCWSACTLLRRPLLRCFPAGMWTGSTGMPSSTIYTHQWTVLEPSWQRSTNRRLSKRLSRVSFVMPKICRLGYRFMMSGFVSAARLSSVFYHGAHNKSQLDKTRCCTRCFSQDISRTLWWTFARHLPTKVRFPRRRVGFYISPEEKLLGILRVSFLTRWCQTCSDWGEYFCTLLRIIDSSR